VNQLYYKCNSYYHIVYWCIDRENLTGYIYKKLVFCVFVFDGHVTESQFSQQANKADISVVEYLVSWPSHTTGHD